MSLDIALSKKRKQSESSQDAPASKKSKKEKRDRTHKREKNGKSRSAGEFKVVKATVRVSIPPIFANNPMAGVEEMLDSLVMRYVPALQGVVLCHSNVHFRNTTASVKWDCPFANCSVGFDATVWSPQIGMKLTAKINLCSPDHISLLVHRTFNVSIPRHHIETDRFEFVYGPAENDPEFGYAALAAKADEIREEPGEMHEDIAVDEVVDGAEGEAGRWIHKVTADSLGGKDGILEFTVIKLTIANQMLSLVGSLQPDPFSPEHVAKPAALSQIQPDSETNAPGTLIQPLDATEQEGSDLEDDDGGDAFKALGIMSDKAKANEANLKVLTEEGTKPKKKRKKDIELHDALQPKEEKKKKKKKDKPSED